MFEEGGYVIFDVLLRFLDWPGYQETNRLNLDCKEENDEKARDFLRFP